jgi:hypothetical protein
VSDALNLLGIKKEKKPDFAQALFYFIREFKINPLDEEWIIDGKKVIKKGMSIPLFQALSEQMQKHYEKEAAEMKKAGRK